MQYLDQILADYNRNTQVCKNFIHINVLATYTDDVIVMHLFAKNSGKEGIFW